MLTPTRLSPDDPRLAELGLPRDRDWYRLLARGGTGLPWSVGHPWPRKFDWSGFGTPAKSGLEEGLLFQDATGQEWCLQLWVQHIGDPREDIYLEALWHPQERRNRIALHGLENSPSDALISSVVRARDWFAPISRADSAP